MNNEAHDYSLDPVRGPSSMLNSTNNTKSNKNKRLLMRKWSNMELKALRTVRNSLHQLYYYISHMVLRILACMCEVLQFAPVRRTRCFPLCVAVFMRCIGRRVEPARAGPDSAHIAFMWSSRRVFSTLGVQHQRAEPLCLSSSSVLGSVRIGEISILPVDHGDALRFWSWETSSPRSRGAGRMRRLRRTAGTRIIPKRSRIPTTK